MVENKSGSVSVGIDLSKSGGVKVEEKGRGWK